MYSVVAIIWVICFLHATAVWGTGLEEEDVDCNFRMRPNNSYLQHNMIFDDEQTCCDGEKYRLGTKAEYLKYFKACNLEPKNKTMSLEDSMWTFSECMIKKSVGSTELTETSFTEFMAQNLSSSKRSAILSLVKNAKATPVKSHGNIGLQPIKNYWANYFVAEYKVCTQSAEYKFDRVKNGIENNWDPVYPCVGGKTPRSPFLPVTTPDVFKCAKSLGEKYPAKMNLTSAFMQHTACYFIMSGLLQEKDLGSTSIKYEIIINNTLPNYFSKSTKERVLQLCLKNIKATYSDKVNGIQEAAQSIKQSAEKLYGNSIPADKKNAYLNMFTLYELFQNLFKGIMQVCMS